MGQNEFWSIIAICLAERQLPALAKYGKYIVGILIKDNVASISATLLDRTNTPRLLYSIQLREIVRLVDLCSGL